MCNVPIVEGLRFRQIMREETLPPPKRDATNRYHGQSKTAQRRTVTVQLTLHDVARSARAHLRSCIAPRGVITSTSLWAMELWDHEADLCWACNPVASHNVASFIVLVLSVRASAQDESWLTLHRMKWIQRHRRSMHTTKREEEGSETERSESTDPLLLKAARRASR